MVGGLARPHSSIEEETTTEALVNPDHGTAIPLRLLADQAPEDDDELLAWLGDLEAEVEDEVQAAWDVVLGRAGNP